jgi:hypothetical protein
MVEDCGDVRDLLDLYVAGSLRPDERATVEHHIAQCAVCRKELAFSQALCSMTIEKEDQEGSRHPSTEIINRLVFTPELMDSRERKAALDHMAVCDRCRREHETLLAVAQDSGITPDTVHRDSLHRNIRAFASRLTRPRAPAWVAVACAVVAILMVVRGGLITPGLPDGGGVFVVSGGVEFDPAPDLTQAHPMTLRGGREPEIFPDIPISDIIIESSDRSINLSIERPDILKGANRADVDLYQLTPGGPVIAASWRNVSVSEGSSPILIPMPAGTLRDGVPLLVVKPSAGPNTPQPASIFRIRISEQPSTDRGR